MNIGLVRIFCITTLGLAALGINTAQAGIVTNGSFETDTVTNSTNWQLFPALTGWMLDTTLSTPGVTDIEVQAGVAGTAFSGNQLVELNSTSPSYIYQDLATTAGQSYFLTWAWSPRPQYSNCVGAQIPADCQPSGGQSIVEDGTVNHLQVLVGSPGSLTTVYDATASGVGLFDTSWIVTTVDFTATGSTTRIEFGDAGSANSNFGYGTFIDGVNADVVAAPEPGTVLMIGAGALGILISRVRKNRQ